LLEKGISEDPKNERYHFYLANSYFDTQNFHKAIENYKKRIELGGWIEEIWYSHYKIGLAYKHFSDIQNNMELAVSYWLNAYNLFPYRVENLYELVEYYRYISKHNLAYLYYRLARKIINNISEDEKNSYLFLNNDIYKYKFDYEFSIIYCYLFLNKTEKINFIIDDKKDDHSDELTNSLMKVFNSYDDRLISITLCNIKFYRKIFKLKSKITLDYSSFFIENVNNEDIIFNSSSSCIIPNKNKDGYIMNIRYVNYTINDSGGYLGTEKNITTINKYVELSKKFEKTYEKVFDLVYNNKYYLGVEDVRIFNSVNNNVNNNSDNIVFMGTSLHDNGKLGISYGQYDKNKVSLDYKELKCSFNNADCEKNWVFCNTKISGISNNTAQQILYKWHPLQICSLNDNHIDLLVERNMPGVFKYARGSSSGFNYNNEIWFVVHVVSYESPRYYYHMIVVFDELMNLLDGLMREKLDQENIDQLGNFINDGIDIIHLQFTTGSKIHPETLNLLIRAIQVYNHANKKPYIFIEYENPKDPNDPAVSFMNNIVRRAAHREKLFDRTRGEFTKVQLEAQRDAAQRQAEEGKTNMEEMDGGAKRKRTKRRHKRKSKSKRKSKRMH
jgi:tetratricopeptide (TPR) repeat protein